MAASADVPVKVVDRVTLPRGAAAEWVARMHREYRPGAQARGYTLEGVWQTRAGGQGPGAAFDTVDVVLEWRLPGVREFFRSRAGSHEPETVAFWAETDALAVARSRSVLGPSA